MKKFEFSIEKLQRYQKQRLRLAELEMQQVRFSLDQSVVRLNELKLRFDEAARSSHEDMDDGMNLTHARRDTLQRLRHEIRQAVESVRENELCLQQIARQEIAERIKVESYEVLQESERELHRDECTRAEMNQLSETIMRTWSDRQGDEEI